MDKIDKPTINDIARLAGVSKTTVSFAFNRPERVSKATYDKIMKISEELCFSPDPGARSLVTKKKNSIGLLLPEITPEGFKNPFLFQVLQGMRMGCVEHGQSLKIISPPSDDLVSAVRSAIVDGIVIFGMIKKPELFDFIQRSKLPVVSFDGGVLNTIPSITSDDFSGGKQVMDYVLQQGHRKIAILSFKDAEEYRNDYSHSAGFRRLEGYESALKEYGLSLSNPDIHVIPCDECSVEGGYSAISNLWYSGTQPTAVVAMSDIIAIGVYSFCKDKKIRIPDTLSVAGYDDIFDSSLISPELTTVKQKAIDKGKTACQVLIRLINGENNIEPVLFDTKLIIRHSVAKI
ncbi:MAG: LacI family DNA-binding transcriptional regulator [Spirochaetia bacterium]